MQEAENVLRILEETIEAIKKEEVVQLRELSNQTIHTASTSQDPDNVAVAVIVYSLSKIVERGAFKEFPDFEKKVLHLLNEVIISVKKRNPKEIHDCLSEIRKTIESFSGKLKEYIKDVFRKASINKASKIYEHGLSIERTSSLLGITMFELASYAGERGFDEKEEKTIDVKSRIKLAMEMFEK